MPYTQTSTALGALSSVVAGSWVAPPRGVNQVPTGGGAGPIVLLAATAVTTGAVVLIEGRYRSGIDMDNSGASAAKELHRITVAANGNFAIPLQDLLDGGRPCDEVRISVLSRTDGTYTGTLITAA